MSRGGAELTKQERKRERERERKAGSKEEVASFRINVGYAASYLQN